MIHASRILLIDDDLTLRRSLADTLEEAGYAVSVANDGAQGMDLLRAGLQPELIILDLMMPVMNGWQFRNVQKRDPTLAAIPVLALSASESPQASAMDAQGFLLKPVDPEQLKAQVETLIEAARVDAIARAQPSLEGRGGPTNRDPARRLSDFASHLHLLRAELPVILEDFRRRLEGRAEAQPGLVRLESLVGEHLDSARRIESVARDLHVLAHGVSVAPTPRARVLIIDDEDAITRSMERLLKRDHQVRALASARDAVKLVQRESFDLILCDLHMPDVTGQEFWEEIQRTAPDKATRVAFMTAGVLNTGMMEFTRTVPCPVVEKPLLPEDVDNLLRRFATH